MRYVPRLERAEIEEATRHTYALWGTGRSPGEHTAHNLAQLDHAGPELLRYVGLVDERGLVASMKRYGLLLRRGDETLRTVGVGAVFTRPDLRRRGLAAELVRAVLGEARDLGYDAAILYSDIDPGYYAKLGFVALPALDYIAPVNALPREGALATRPANEGDLDRLLAWHEEAWSRAPTAEWVRPMRTRVLWRYFQWRNRIDATWILTEGGRDVGYLVAGTDDPLRDMPDPREDGLFWIDEWALPGIDDARVPPTARRLAEQARARVVGSWLRVDRASRSDGAFAAFTPRARPSAFPMIAPLRPSFVVDPTRAYLGSFEHF